MKPAAFRYEAPREREEALALLAAHGDEAKVLAGGQSLAPMMNFRLVRPAVLIDINRINGLDYVQAQDGILRIGALARHATFEHPVADGVLGRLLPRVARHIAHWPIRTRGTFAGSLAHADPASEWCLIAATLEAEITLASRRGTRAVRPAAYFVGALTTVIEPDELLTEVRLPVLGDGWTAGFMEFSRRAGDYALAMCAALLKRDHGRIVEARVGVGGAAECPQRITAAERVLVGSDGGPAARREAAEIAARSIEPLEDQQASGALRRDLTRAMVDRALAQAVGP